MSLKTSLRTQGCGELRVENVGQEVTLCGWLQTRRDHGGVLFLDLRDRSGVAQVVVHPQKAEAFEAASALRSEYVLRVTGKVAKRPAGTENPSMPTGLVEVPVEKLEVLNRCEPLPFEVSDQAGVSEESRLKYRYLDLRRPRMLANLTLRSKAAQAARNFLAGEGFLEIETPILTKSTPEGARDFLVPARMSPGEFYALPQSPQIFKQILMVAGMERYFQLARAFRDEDLRADRQPEHTQIDVEMSFVSQEDVHAVAEGLMKAVFKETIGVELETPFTSLEFSEAMLRFGSDKPDIRYGLELTDLTQTFQASEFKVFGETARGGGKVLALNAAGAGNIFSRGDLDKLVEFVKAAGAKGLPWIRFADGKAESPIVKFLKESELAELRAKLGVKDGDVVFFGVGEPYVAAGHLGTLRKELIIKLGLKPSKPWAFLWVKHFPLLEWDKEENRWTFAHNPFTAPLASEIPMLDTDPGKMRSHQYDLVLNGVELASGSIRNNRPEIQQKIFALMGYEPAEQERRFGLLLNALRFGAPPHGGFGLGFDRLCAILRGEDSIREVIAFPKTAKGTDLMSECPSPANARQLKELHIQTTVKPTTPDGKPVH